MADPKKTPPAGTAAPKKDGKTPRERFTTVGATRVKKALKALRNLTPVASKKSYEYSEADFSKMFGALETELAALKTTFRAALDGKSTAKADDSFTF